MSNQRRRACNFTDSLNSFHQTITISKDESSQVSGEFHKHSCSENTSCVESVILAGSSTNQQFISDSCNIAEESYNMLYKNRHPLLMDGTLIVSDGTSYLSVKPDLNKCINLFNNEYLDNEYDGAKNQLSPTLSETNICQDINFCDLNKKFMGQQDLNNHRRSMSAESLRNIILNRELKRSKSYTVLDKALRRDRNYNIKGDQLSFPTKNTMKKTSHEEIETVVSSFEDNLSLSKYSSLLNKKDDSLKENQHNSSNEMSSKDELSPFELKVLLQSLTDQKLLKETAVQQRLLRRLSVDYHDAPKVCTENLLTIIEESVINDDSHAQAQYPELSLFRFNEEIRKMCKFLEDETVPEWPESPGMSTPICTKRKSRESNDLLQKSINALSPDKGLHFTTPASSQCNNKSPKKACLRMSKNTSYVTKNLLNDTNTFESLEAMCKQLFPDNDYTVPREKNLLQSPLQSMANILRTCENQMASLENSPIVHEQIKKAGTCTSDSTYQHKKLPEESLEYRLLVNEKYDRMDSEAVLDILKQQTEHSKRQEMIESNDFEGTVMYEIAKKRQRCLDTAKIVMEIDENFKTMEEIHPNINDSSIEVDDKLMKTLMSVKKYQDYLERYKPLINLFHRTRLSSPRTPCNRQDVQAEKTPNKDFNTCALSVVLEDKQTLQISNSSPRKKSISPPSTKKPVVTKPRLFITPGKTLDKNCKPKRAYFPNLLPGMNKQNKHVSPQARNIYRQIGNYDHVISPVGVYIKGAEFYQTKNLKPITDKTLLTPKKKSTQSPNSKMELQLSPKPKEKLTGTIGDENVADNFLHPKIYYNYPSHSRVIEETENLKVGNCGIDCAVQK
ncbi:PREDICTED: uncharacterized protein LOC108768753 [Trachymyrmex cornetzi]|uniref:Uncharacterized protein n=1 Tax=Trachymyrmex cornetzi TaxID=471704 RepID=A0A195DCA3_9HYME|nr:PREDICTED: uncharacterized protein LOC108768753 [Trachymyrmex cornetzi]KYN10518.1 hypothetical protein ALC57_17123 [Trachymyrmex cornetzi]